MREVLHGRDSELPESFQEMQLRQAKALADALQYRCGPCGAVFLSPAALDLHILSHHPEDVFEGAA